MAVVYWLHLKEQTDISSQGYIGVSATTACHRYKRHLRASLVGDYIIHKAIRKYGERIVVTTLVEGDSKYCYSIEQSLRPTQFTGWNMVKGGMSRSLEGISHSLETRKKMSISQKTSYENPDRLRHCVGGWNKGTVSVLRPWQQGRANKSAWFKAANAAEVYSKDISIGYKRLSKLLGISPKSSENILNMLRSDWNPIEDLEWLSFKENYKESNGC